MEKLKFLGIGGATNVKLGSNSCFIKRGNKLLLIDVCESATEKLVRNHILDDIEEVYIAITHTHFDHVAGLGVLVWYLYYNFKIKPIIIYNNKKYLSALKRLFEPTGILLNTINFIKDKDFILDDLTLKLKKTTHVKKLICNGIMFKDNTGKYYYTGDTNDIEYIRKVVKDKNVKKVYTEVSEFSYNVHIPYDELLKIKNDKLVLMHIGSMKIYDRAKKDGFNIGEVL